jgi:BMFP domain-containing protein YqiC
MLRCTVCVLDSNHKKRPITIMNRPNAAQLIADIQEKILAMMRTSPAGDLERNLKALLEQAFERMDLVTRSALEIERERLTRLQERVAALEHALGTNAGDPSRGAER